MKNEKIDKKRVKRDGPDDNLRTLRSEIFEELDVYKRDDAFKVISSGLSASGLPEEYVDALRIELSAHVTERMGGADPKEVASWYENAAGQFRKLCCKEHALACLRSARDADNSLARRLTVRDSQRDIYRETWNWRYPFDKLFLDLLMRYWEPPWGTVRLALFGVIVYLAFTALYLPGDVLIGPDVIPRLVFTGGPDPTDRWTDAFAVSAYALFGPLIGGSDIVEPGSGWTRLVIAIEAGLGYGVVLFVGGLLSKFFSND